MLARFFINDTSDTGTWRLKGHAVQPFWEWVATWAACAQKPSDAGGDDERFKLLPLTYKVHTVESLMKPDIEEGLLFSGGGSLSATGTNAKLRFKTGVQILVRLGGKISNASGNNSNHAIIIHCYCVWGKQCCGSNDDIIGDRLVSESNPCGWVALQHRADSVNVFAEMQDGLTKIGSTLSVNMQEFDSDVTIKIFDFSGRLVFNSSVNPVSSVDISSINTSGFYILTLEAEGLMIINRKVYHESI